MGKADFQQSIVKYPRPFNNEVLLNTARKLKDRDSK